MDLRSEFRALPISADNLSGADSRVYLPSGLGFDTGNFPINPSLYDPGGMALASGNAGLSPEHAFDRLSNARINPMTIYRVGPGGSDANSGFSSATKKLSIGGCFTAGNATGAPYAVVLDDGVDFYRQMGPANVVPTQDVYITTVSGGRARVGLFEQASVYTPFAVNGTYSNVYSMPLANADRVCNRLAQNVYGSNTDHDLYASVAALSAATLTNDGYALDGTNIHIRRVDSQKPTYTNTALYRASGVHNFVFSSPVNVFVENIDAEGGMNGVFEYNMTTKQSATKIFVAKNATASYGGGNVNTECRGFGAFGMKGLMYLDGCGGRANATDLISGHDPVSSGTQVLSVNCWGIDSGRSGHLSCNNWTLHEDCVGIDIAGNYKFGRGGNVRSVSARALCAGTYSSDLGDGQVGPAAFFADTGHEMWCDRTKADLPRGGSNIAYYAVTGSKVHLSNARSSGAINGGGGVIDAYLPMKASSSS
jgi:hypothetical protein